jgi:hypothetical protein
MCRVEEGAEQETDVKKATSVVGGSLLLVSCSAYPKFRLTFNKFHGGVSQKMGLLKNNGDNHYFFLNSSVISLLLGLNNVT